MRYGDFTVRDRRRPGHHWADNEVIDDFGKIIGAYGYAVYMFLSRHAGNDNGRCVKTQGQIADAFGISTDTVSRACQKLIDCGLISVEKHLDNTLIYYIGTVEKRKPLPLTAATLAAHSGNPLPLTAVRSPLTAATLPLTAESNKEAILLQDSTYTKPNTVGRPPSAEQKNQITDQMAARAFCEELGFSGALIHQTAYSAIQSYRRHNPHKSAEEAFYDMVALWREYEAAAIRTKCGAQSWLSQGIYHHPEKWRKSQSREVPPAKDSSKKHETPSALPIIEEMRRKRAHAQAQAEEPGK